VNEDRKGQGAAPRRITCLIADDHPAVAQLLGRYLEEQGIQVVGTAHDGEQAIALIEESQPDLALLDLRMPHASGIDVARRILGLPWNRTAVIIYSGFGERDLLLHALDLGVRGFVQKEAPLEEVVRAVRLVHQGEIYIDPVLSAVLVSAEAATRLKTLTPRQREVLAMVADGKTTDQIAQALFITRDTVRAHVRSAMETLQADTRTHAVAKALRQSLIT
jgi:DNA-binding NarL/FixJ family response regulator